MMEELLSALATTSLRAAQATKLSFEDIMRPKKRERIRDAQCGRKFCHPLARDIVGIEILTEERRGTGVGVINKILSVDELFKSIQQEAKFAVARVMERI